MDPFAPVKIANGTIAYAGTVQSDEHIGVHVFSIKLNKGRKFYGSFIPKFEPDGDFYISVFSFGFSEKNMVGNTDNEYMHSFTSSDISEISDIIRRFFSIKSIKKDLYLFNLAKSKFNENVEFAPGWIKIR